MEEIMDLQKEQNEILQLIDDNKLQIGTKVWSKYYRDVVCRIVAHYLSKHLPPKLRMVGPNAYIAGFPTEFDLLVADTKVTPAKFTNAYPLDQVCCVIEVKTQGIRSKVVEFTAEVGKIRDKFQPVVNGKPNLKCAYIAIEEQSPAPKQTAIPDLETGRIRWGAAPQTAFDYAKKHRMPCDLSLFSS